jgi:AbrB family looped-hinge helix DNA binding protein
MPLARLSSKSQIAIPAAIRRKLGFQAGDLLEIAQEGDHLVLRKAPGSYVDALDACGSAVWKGYTGELEKARGQWDR